MSMKQRLLGSILLLLSCVILPVAIAQPPGLINYQGRLVDGTNLVNGTVHLTFRIHTNASGGNFIYEATNSVAVVDGLYATQFGDGSITTNSVISLNQALNRGGLLSALWLEVAVNGTNLTPRERLLSAPYARQVYGLYADNNNIVLGAPSSGNTIPEFSQGSAIGGGTGNKMLGLSADVSVIAGGRNNIIDTGFLGEEVTISGGHANSVRESDRAVIGGGFTNRIDFAVGAAIGGGEANSISNQSPYAVIGGGWRNRIRSGSTNSVIGGGAFNVVDGPTRHAVIAGGFSNRLGASIFAPTISGGRESEVYATYGVVGGGIANHISSSSFQSTIGGGFANRMEAAAPNSVIGGGQGNVIRGGSAFVGGGDFNLIQTSGFHSVVVGGLSNRVEFNAQWSSIGGGKENRIGTNSTYATVVGGLANRATGSGSAIGGGAFNVADGQYATIPGGEDNVAVANAFAAGRRAKANHSGAFVWGDSTASDVVSTNANSVTMRAGGGYRLFSNGGMSIGAQLTPFASSWAAISDRNAKENFAPIDTAEILDKVAALPLTAWTYKDDPTHRRYIGPVAQDFHAAFGLGNDTTINTLDADGVALAAIQALAKERNATEEKVSGVSVRVSELEEENARLREELEAIKQKLGM